ncbi:unnamed protein product [Adineta steineri]|uniref:Nuclear receptor domain-containing protein n=1 Tax=Adineta steineri TaxID=433720 RepID=A0A816BCN8_9BILA|nr:unnamed protein product [Adineta steineri]CAF1607497.1 unnamed protein product [Adineta steineri]
MYFNQPLPILTIQRDQSSNRHTKNDICRICGDKAYVINYGALSCSSCKTFFRRHGFHSQHSLECNFNAKCCITQETRKYCAACRFAKCLTAGMDSDLIRKEDLYAKHRQPHSSQKNKISKKITSIPQLFTLDLLFNDRSSLTSFDWTMLSNVINAFDKFNSVFQTRQLIESFSSWPQHFSFDISQVLSLFASFYKSTESFISSSADFQILTLTEKHSLYQRNLHGVLNLCATFILSLSGMFNISTNDDSILASIHGYDIYQQTKQISMRLEYDTAIIKLMLIALAFSSNCYMVDKHEHMHNDSLLLGTFRLFGSQNMYIEILWKYMMYRYGYSEAAIRLLILVKIILDLLKMSANIHRTNDFYHNFVDEAVLIAENIVTRNEKEVVKLWGRP